LKAKGSGGEMDNRPHNNRKASYPKEEAGRRIFIGVFAGIHACSDEIVGETRTTDDFVPILKKLQLPVPNARSDRKKKKTQT